LDASTVSDASADLLPDIEQGCDCIELVLLDAYNRIFDLPFDLFDDPCVRANIQSMYKIVDKHCRHILREPVATLYYVKKGLMFREFRLCLSCFTDVQNNIKNVSRKYPEHIHTGYHESIGSVFGFYRFVLVF